MASPIWTSSITVDRFLLALDVYDIWREKYEHEEAVKLTTYCGSKAEYTVNEILDIYHILKKHFSPESAKRIITFIEERKGFFLPDLKAN
jgi:hypothetical protein